MFFNIIIAITYVIMIVVVIAFIAYYSFARILLFVDRSVRVIVI